MTESKPAGGYWFREVINDYLQQRLFTRLCQVRIVYVQLLSLSQYDVVEEHSFIRRRSSLMNIVVRLNQMINLQLRGNNISSVHL